MRPSIVLSGMLLAVLPSLAHADDQRPPPKQAGVSSASEAQDEYSALVKKAVTEFELGNWPEAKVFFLRAHQLRPSARTLRGLGLVCYELRGYVEAVGYLRDALASQQNPLTGELRAKVESTLHEAEGFIAARKLILKPVNATLRVDDHPPVLHEDRLLLDPGPHELTAEAAGYQPLKRNLRAESGDQSELLLALTPIETQPQPVAHGQASPAPARATSSPSDDRSFWSMNTQQAIGVSLGIGGIVALGVGATFGGLAIHENGASDKGCDDNNVCTPAGTRHRNAAFDRASVATVGFVAGGVLLASGVVVYLLAPDDEDAAAISLSPAFGFQGAALSLRGRL